MKIYEWGFDKAGFSIPESVRSFLNANHFIEVSHGYRGAEHKVITYANPKGVILVTYNRGYRAEHDENAADDGYFGYVGITGFNQKEVEKVLNDLRLRSPTFTYEDESPNRRDYI